MSLLDTHALLWWLNDDEKLGNHARGLIGAPENDVLVSAVSLWEITVDLLGSCCLVISDGFVSADQAGSDRSDGALASGDVPGEHRRLRWPGAGGRVEERSLI